MHYYFKQSIAFCAIAIGSLAVNDVDADGWPIVRFQNGTVGVQNEGGEVHVRADVMKLNTNVLMLNDIDLIPPKCMAPGGDRLQHNGTHFVCFCTESWSGRTCEVPPSPPPPSPPSPPPSLSVEDFIQSKDSLYSRLDIDNHVSGQYVFDIALDKEWSASATQKPNIVTIDGKSCLDMDSTVYIRISPPSGYPALGQYYTQFYIWKPRLSDSTWRTLYRNSYDHLTLVQTGTKNLGVWSTRNQRSFHDSGYDIIVQWQVLIAVSEGDSATSSTGTTSFYINDDVGNAVLVGSSNRVGSGTTLYEFGHSDEFQAPGYLIEAGILNEKLSAEEIQEFMFILKKKMDSTLPQFLNDVLFEYKPENVVGTTVKDTSSSSLSIGDAYLSQSGCISVGSSGDVFQASCTTSESYENVIQTPEIDLRRDFTLETYVKFTDRSTHQFLFGQGTNTANAGLHIGVVSSSRGFVFGFYGNDLDSGWIPTLNTWYHLVFTYTHSGSSSTKNIYIDGVLKKTGSGSAYAYNGSYKKLLIGKGYGRENLSDGERFGFSGEMKFARMYPTTLTSDEVSYLYSQT